MKTTIYHGWRCTHIPTNGPKERHVATRDGATLTAATQTSLQRKIEAAMEEAFA